MKQTQMINEQERRDYFIAHGMMAFIQLGYQTQDVATAAVRLADEVLALAEKAKEAAQAPAKQTKK